MPEEIGHVIAEGGDVESIKVREMPEQTLERHQQASESTLLRQPHLYEVRMNSNLV